MLDFTIINIIMHLKMYKIYKSEIFINLVFVVMIMTNGNNKLNYIHII